MPKNDSNTKAFRASVQGTIKFVAAKLVEDDPRKILSRAEKRPLRIAVRLGGRNYHIATVRHGAASDPAWRTSVPVTVAALKRHGVRILGLGGALQIALRVQLGKDSADAFFIEPGRECYEFALARLGGPIDEVASFKRLLRHSRFARAAADGAAELASAQGRDEIDGLTRRIGQLDRSLKTQIALSAKHEKRNAALRKAQADRVAAVNDTETQLRDEISQLKSRIRQLERSLKRRVALDEGSKDSGDTPADAPDEPLENGSIDAPPS